MACFCGISGFLALRFDLAKYRRRPVCERSDESSSEIMQHDEALSGGFKEASLANHRHESKE